MKTAFRAGAGKIPIFSKVLLKPKAWSVDIAEIKRTTERRTLNFAAAAPRRVDCFARASVARVPVRPSSALKEKVAAFEKLEHHAELIAWCQLKAEARPRGQCFVSTSSAAQPREKTDAWPWASDEEKPKGTLHWNRKI